MIQIITIFLRIADLNFKTKTITISSGKGGVGKTCTSVNLALLLAQHGYKTCILDADANLANINIMLKLNPEFTLEHVISGEKTLEQITLHKNGIQVIPGYSGLSDFISLNNEQRQRLLKTLRDLKVQYDYLIIDNPAGISKNVLSYIQFSDHNIIIITPEPTSLTDAFSLIRVANKSFPKKRFHIIVNNISDKGFATKVFNRFSMAVKKHIGIRVEFLGHIVADELLTSSVCQQSPVVIQHPTATSTVCFENITNKLLVLATKALQKKLSDPNIDQSKSSLRGTSPTISKPGTEEPQKKLTPATKAIPINELKPSIIDYFANPNNEQENLKSTLEEINNIYNRRFNSDKSNLSHELYKAVIATESISEPTLRNLLMTLHSLYQDQYIDSNAIESGELEKKQESIDLVVKLLQQESLSLSGNRLSDNNINTQLQNLINTPAKEQDTSNELLDSIRYAALTDN